MSQEVLSSDLSKAGESRRKLLISIPFLAVAAGSLAYRVFHPLEEPQPNQNSKFLITGIVPNCLYLPYLPPEVQEKMVENLEACEASAVRVFLDDRFEERLGKFNLQYLDQIAQASRRTPITLDLYDGYHLLHKKDPDSPYLGESSQDLTQRQMGILLDDKTKEAFLQRTAVVVGWLRGEPGIKAWGLANELNLRKRRYARAALSTGKSLKTLHTDLFESQIQTILSIDRSRPILIGVDDPNLIDEERLSKYQGLVFNTIHVYPARENEQIIREYIQTNEHYLPLVCQEVGYSRSLVKGGVHTPEEYDAILARFLSNTLVTLYPHITAFGPWRITAPGDSHSDGYEIDPHMMNETLKVIKTAKEILVS